VKYLKNTPDYFDILQYVPFRASNTQSVLTKGTRSTIINKFLQLVISTLIESNCAIMELSIPETNTDLSVLTIGKLVLLKILTWMSIAHFTSHALFYLSLHHKYLVVVFLNYFI